MQEKVLRVPFYPAGLLHYRVTPKTTKRKKRIDNVDWEQLDEEYVQLAQQAVQKILHAEGKTKRITKLSIRNAMGRD